MTGASDTQAGKRQLRVVRESVAVPDHSFSSGPDLRKTSRRRQFLHSAALGFSALGGSAALSATRPESWLKAGSGFSNYGVPDTESNGIIRWKSPNPSVPGEGASWTPLHQLQGTIIPNGLHFERHHNGVPEIVSGQWTLTLHGQVKQALSFDLENLHRYPMESRIGFIECGGNSNALWHERPVQAAVGHLHGLVSCAEWTGIRLSTLLEEAGIEPDAQWVIADGLDASGVTTSLPLEKCLDDVLVLSLIHISEPTRPY